jgi:hypothetical protein
MNFLWGIFQDILSNVIFLLLAILIAYLWTALTQRKNLLTFFNTTDIKRLVIYLSNIKVLPFGAMGISQDKLSYQGETVAYGEMQVANQIQSLFNFIVPKLAESSQSIGRLLLSDVKVQISISPQEISELETEAPVVSLGSSAFNIASRHIEDLYQGSVKFRFAPNPISGSTTAQDSNLPVSVLVSNSTQENREPLSIFIDDLLLLDKPFYGCVERIRDPGGNRSLFYVAGLSEFSTKGAGYYLSSQWKYLYKKYGAGKSFLIQLKI